MARKVIVQAKANARSETIELISEGLYSVKVRVAPEDGKANKRIIELLSKVLNVPKSKITLVKGHKSKSKVFEVDD